MKRRSRSMLALMLVLALGLGVVPTIHADPDPTPAQPGPDPRTGVLETAPGASGDWWEKAQEEIQRSEYHASWQDPTNLADVAAAFQAPNRAHNLRTYFTPAGIRVVPRTVDGGQWQMGLGLAGFTSGGHRQAVGEAEPVASENRVEYGREGVTEWYVNGEDGLAHGVRLTAGVLPDAPGPATGDGTLSMDLALGSDLVPGLAGGGMAVDFGSAEGTPVLRYSVLLATDSNGKVLATELNLVPRAPDATRSANQALRVRIDDLEAPYPITLTATLTSLSPAAGEVEPAAPTDLSTTADWTAESNVAHAEFGASVSTAGDVNGDGYSDVIVGAPMFDGGNPEQGRAFVYHGSEDGLPGSPDWQVENAGGDMQLGYSVAIAGDVNGDGYADVIVGAPYHDYPGQVERGRALVYFGSATGLDLNGTRPLGSTSNADWSKYGPAPGDHLGISVATAGDVDGDGYSDIIVGAPDHDVHFATPDRGLAWVFHGSAGGLSTSSGWSAQGGSMGDRFGHSVATAGDVNADFYSDVIVGAIDATSGEAGEGKAYVYQGTSTGLNASPYWTAESNQAGARFGLVVDTAGDVDGDGFSDVIIGADYYSHGQDYEGGVFVYHGSGAGLGDAGTPSNADWSYERDQVWAVLGCAVSAAGDVNGDGYADVIVGARNYSMGQDGEGAAFVFHGSGSGLSTTPLWMAEGDQADARFGVSVGTAGDVNGDGYSDVIVGAKWYGNGQEKEGRAFVYHGAPVRLAATPAWTREGNHSTARFGRSVGTAGDVDGDGYADVIVGAPTYDGGEDNEGRVYVYLGSAEGLNPTAHWWVESNAIGAAFGASVGTAGDVNGDGYSDVIVGASYFSNGQQDEGKAFVYHGSAVGLSATPGWTHESNVEDAFYGGSVGTAGDVNGDGYSDVIVGANFFSGTYVLEGRAEVYHGSAAGLASVANWTAAGGQPEADFGFSVGTAGDVNRDGYSDVVVGAPGYTNGQDYEGRALVFHGGAAGLGASPDWTAESDQVDAEFGRSVGTAGDVNGDGYSDVIVGAPGYSFEDGRAYVYHGGSTGLTATPDWTHTQGAYGGLLGRSVGTAGDVNGDGYAEVIVGAPWNSIFPTADAGQALLFHGSTSGLSELPKWSRWGMQSHAHYGFSVGTAGDINGDGYAEIIVGAPHYESSPAEDLEGKAFLYYGNGGHGLDLGLCQWNGADSSMVAPLGVSGSATTVQIGTRGRMPLGRSQVKAQWQVAPLGTPFGAAGTVDGTTASTWDTNPDVRILHTIWGLTPGTPYHWRVRFLYLPGNRLGQAAGRWLHMPWNGWNETDFRTLGRHTIFLPLVERGP